MVSIPVWAIMLDLILFILATGAIALLLQFRKIDKEYHENLHNIDHESFKGACEHWDKALAGWDKCLKEKKESEKHLFEEWQKSIDLNGRIMQGYHSVLKFNDSLIEILKENDIDPNNYKFEKNEDGTFTRLDKPTDK